MSDLVPHLRFPLVVAAGRFSTVEQDSPQDVSQCVKCLLRTPRGWRSDMPDLGVGHVVFTGPEVSAQQISDQIDLYEPRAESLVDAAPELMDEALTVVNLRLAIHPDDAAPG